jgi:uncharacterized protein involved in exopolysaccharide biosynthesis
MSEEEWHDEDEGGGALVSQLTSIALDPLGVVRRRWVWMLLGLVLGLLGTGVVYLNLKPLYQAKSTILVSSQQIPEEFVRSTVAGLDSLANVNALMGEVLSQNNLADLVLEHDLYPRLRERAPLAEVVEVMRNDILIDQQQQHTNARRNRAATASIFAISYTSQSPALAADVANALAGIFIESNLAKRSEQARLTTDFLRRELEASERELREVNGEIAEFNRQHRGALPGDQESLLRKLERLELSKQTLSRQIEAAEQRRASLRDNNGGDISNAEKELMELRMLLASQLAVHTDQHPNVIALRRRISVMEGEMSEIAKLLEASTPQAPANNRAAEVNQEISNLRQQLLETEQEIRELDLRAVQIPDNEEKLGALQQRAGVLRETYLDFLRKVQDAELSETLETAQQGAQVSILDRATVPTAPMRSSLLIAAIGLLGTLGLTVVVGVGLEIVDPVVLSAMHLEHVGQTPLLGSIHRLTT